MRFVTMSVQDMLVLGASTPSMHVCLHPLDWTRKKGFFSEQPPIGSRLEFSLPTYCVSELALANVLRKDPTYASYVSADN
jgi:hypothetical protein